MSGSPPRTTAGDTRGSKASCSNSARRVSASTIGRVLNTLPIPPAPQRHTDISWRGLLHAQAATTLATGFFHVDRAFTRRLYCLFVIDAGSRYDHIPGVTTHPDGPRATQQIRNLLIDLGDRAADFRFLSATAPGSAPHRLTRSWPARASRLRRPRPVALARMRMRNGFVHTARTEVTDRMLIFGERHLRSALAEYARHYNRRRPHRSRPLHPPRPDHPAAGLSQERIRRRPVLGGLLNEYQTSRVEDQVNTPGRPLEPRRPSWAG